VPTAGSRRGGGNQGRACRIRGRCRSAGRGCWISCGGGWGSARGDPARGDPPGRVRRAVRSGREPGVGSVVQAASHRAGRRTWIDGLPETSDDACYRTMDWLHQVNDPVEQEIFGQVANLLNLEIDLLFFDTTTPAPTLRPMRKTSPWRGTRTAR